MKLKFTRLEVVTVLTPALCHHNCQGNEHDYPLGRCNVFHDMREHSDSEGVKAYKRLPVCIERATERYMPELPKLGDKLVFAHTKTEHTVVEVRAIQDDYDEWQVRLAPPLSGTFKEWVWITQRYFRRST